MKLLRPDFRLPAILSGMAAYAFLTIGSGAQVQQESGSAGTAGDLSASDSSHSDKVVIVGDSTACVYPKTMPYRGWGQFLHYYMKDSVEVVDAARPGRSTGSYMLEGSWKGALREKPKLILIQFGTNDAKFENNPREKVAVDPEVGYRKFLNRYIDGAMTVNAIPVLISPAHPRVFDGKGRLVDLFASYVQSMKKVAATRGVAMVDLYTESGVFFQKFGKERCRQFQPVPGDDIHFNATAAKAMAEIVVRHLARVEPHFAELMGPDPHLLGVEHSSNAETSDQSATPDSNSQVAETQKP